MDERRKRRMRELDEDAADRAKDEEELAAAAAQAAAEPPESPAAAANGAADMDAEQSPHADADTAVKTEPEVKQEGVKQEEDDAIFQAMQAAAFGGAPSPQQQYAQPAQQQQPPVAQPSPQQQQPAGLARPAGTGKRGARVAVSALFGEDEEEVSKKRKLVPIKYSDDEIKAVQDHTQALSDAAAQAAVAAAGGQPPQEQEQQQQPQHEEVHYPAYPAGLDLSGCKSFLRQWMDTLPNTTEPLYT
jgi:hypothetical protein